MDITHESVLSYILTDKVLQFNIWASKGFDGGTEAGEASRMVMREMAKLKLNANDNLAYAA